MKRISPLATAAEARTPTPRVLVKARSITLREFKLNGVAFGEVVRKPPAAGHRQDVKRTGTNFVVLDAARAEANPKITLPLRTVTVAEAAERLAQPAGLRVEATDDAFVFQSRTDQP